VGVDFDNISVSDVRLDVDSIYYGPEGVRAKVSKAAMKERSGLEITELKGAVSVDPEFNIVTLPGMTLRTPDSDIYAEADIDLRAFDTNGQQGPQGKIHARLNAQIGKQDMLKLGGDLIPQDMMRRWPNQPLQVRGSVNGNMERMELTGIDMQLPNALHVKADGVVYHLTDTERLKADLAIETDAHDLGFAEPLIAEYLPKDVRIPRGITLRGKVKADGPRYDFDVTAREGQGTVTAKGNYNGTTQQYDADVQIRQLNVRHFLPRDSIGLLTAKARLQGRGTDVMSANSRMNADIQVQQLQYGHWDLTDISAQATLSNGRANACLQSHNPLLDGTVSLDAQLSSKRIDATLEPDLQLVDLHRLRLVEHPLSIGMNGTVELHTDMNQSHEVRARLGHLAIRDDNRTFHPEDLGIYLNTNRDTTWVRAQSGDLKVKLDATGGYERLLSKVSLLSDSVIEQFSDKRIDQPAIKRLLPSMRLHVESGRNNPVANILRSRQIDFRDLLIDLTTSTEEGVNGDIHLYGLNADSVLLDTIALRIRQKGDRMTYSGQVTNTRRNPQFVFNALFDGHLTDHGALVGVRYFDERGRMGIRLGASADMVAEGLRFHLIPERPTVGYKEFKLNADNYILVDQNNRLQAQVDLIADDGTGLKLYSESQDSTLMQDLTLSVNRLNLGELTSAVPYLPKLTGILNGDYHIVMDHERRLSVVSDMAVHDMGFEGAAIGNLSTELVYMQREDDGHAIEARLMLDDEEFGLLTGSILPSSNTQAPGIDAKFTMTRFPLSLVNGFIPDQIVGLEGYGEGELAIKGTTSRPVVDGEVYVDSAYLVSYPYGVRMRFDNDPVRIVGSHLLLENFGLYAYNEEPLNMQGDLDFSDLDNMQIDLRMRARNLQLINAKQTSSSVAFGRAFVNFFARMNGPLEAMNMRGRLDVLSSTDMTYMLLDSPLNTDNRLDELVKFTDFSDTTLTVTPNRPTPTGLNMDMTISVAQGAHIVCGLNTEQTNYIDLMGGGDLRMRYDQAGLNLTGRYTLNRGEMKYSLPIIPLKTFTIKDGSYVEFTGDPMNPRLNITATERNKAPVNDNGNNRTVTFECGVVITKTLNDMGLEFIIDAPEDNAVNGDLTSMTAEERSKVAVAMLTTGMYLADSNTSAFSMNSALSSFLQSEINNIAGSALKTLDLSVGVENSTDATGAMKTDYSFKFAKRFFNNRLKIELGGVVSSGNSVQGQKNSFFDNVTMEYRLNQSGTQNMKLFYQQNAYDWLDGYTNVYGGGFLWRRKLSNFWDILRFWKPEEQPRPTMTVPRDSTRIQRRDTMTVQPITTQ